MTKGDGQQVPGLGYRLWQFAKARPSASIVAVAVTIAVVLIATRPRETSAPRPERAWVVDTLHVEKLSLRPTLELFGSVQSPQDAELSAGIEANVVDVEVLDGETVTAGQTLVLLDGRDAELSLRQQEANVLEIEAQYSLAERRLELNQDAFQKEQELFELSESRQGRARELYDLKRLSQSEFENSSETFKRQQLALNQAQLSLEESSIRVVELQAQLSRAEALLEQAALNVERAVVKAPFDGVVSEPQVSEGDRVRIGDALMRLQNPASIEVRAQIPARYADRVAEGLAAGIAMQALVEIDDRVIRGKLKRVSGLTREGSGGVDAFVGFNNVTTGLRLGSTVRVLLELSPEDDVIAIPAEGVYGRDRLYKVDEGRMKMIVAERIGERSLPDGRTEVLLRSDTLEADDQIITTKLANASDGLLVRLVEEVSSKKDTALVTDETE